MPSRPLLVALLFARLAAADASPEQPIGYRHDGNGSFPDARIPLEFGDGTPVETEIAQAFQVAEKPAKPIKTWTISDQQARNIAWKTELPCWGNTQPIATHGRVFVKAEPNRMVCVDGATGKILWTRSANAWAAAGVDAAKAATAQELWELAHYGEPTWSMLTSSGTMACVFGGERYRAIAEPYAAAVQPRLLAALKELDPQGKYGEAAQSVLAAVKAFPGAPAGGKPGKIADTLRKAIFGRIQAITGRKDIPDNIPWYNLVGNATAVPVTDGKRVYATYGQGQIAAWTLDGEPVWATWLKKGEHADGKEANCSHIPSPVLAEGVLMVNQDWQTLAGLDAQTGKLRWTFTGGTTGGDYSVATAKVVRLPLATGKDLSVVVTPLGRIVRIADGKKVGDLGVAVDRKANWSVGPSITTAGDLVFKGGNTGFAAFRLRAASADAVEATPAYTVKSGPHVHGAPADERIAFTGTELFDVATGASIAPLGKAQGVKFLPTTGYSALRVGQHLLVMYGDYDRYGQHALFQFIDVSGAEPKVLPRINVLAYAKPRNPAMEKYAPELYAYDGYCNHSAGFPYYATCCDTPFTVSGDRLLVRSNSHLYCIADASTEP